MQHLSQHHLDMITKIVRAQERLEDAVNEAIQEGLRVAPHVFFLNSKCHITTKVIPKQDNQPSKQLELFT